MLPSLAGEKPAWCWLRIRPEHQQIIFEAFRQASEGYGRMHEGTGLGLAIVRAIVSIYGGTIKVESEQGKGSVFILSLPAILTEEGEVVRAGHDQRRKSKMEPVPNKQTFELILMDINLGEGKDGMEITREIRTMPAFKHVPIIAMTGYTASQDKERIFAAGCSHYLGKPFTKKQLIDLIGDVVK